MTKREYLEIQRHNAFVDKVNFVLAVIAGISFTALCVVGAIWIIGGIGK